LIQSDAFLKKLTQVSFSSKDKERFVSHTRVSEASRFQDKPSFISQDIFHG
jgi:hypothetical protein